MINWLKSCYIYSDDFLHILGCLAPVLWSCHFLCSSAVCLYYRYQVNKQIIKALYCTWEIVSASPNIPITISIMVVGGGDFKCSFMKISFKFSKLNCFPFYQGSEKTDPPI